MNNIENYYDNDYHRQIHANLFENQEYYWARSEVFHKLYFGDHFSQDFKVLDYGCGLGQASAHIKQRHGYDASKDAREFVTKLGYVVYENKEDIPSEAFDFIICRHVLEHLSNPYETLCQLRSYLKPNGVLKLILPKEAHGKSPFTPDSHMHLQTWNFRTINNLLSLSGFTVTANKQLFHWGFTKLLPIKRVAGSKCYFHAAKLFGHLTRTAELYIEAKNENQAP